MQEHKFQWKGKYYVSEPQNPSLTCEGCAFQTTDNRDCSAANDYKDCADPVEIIWKETEESFQEESKESLSLVKQEIKQGIKHDKGKARYDLIPALALEELAKVLTFGADSHNEHYDDENWRRVPFAERRFYSAAQRHLAEVRKGNPYDIGEGGSNCHHYACAISSLMFLLQKELEVHKELETQRELENNGNKKEDSCNN